MSEQPNSTVSLNDYREGSRFDDELQIDLHKNIHVPTYNYEAILQARKVFEQPVKPELDPAVINIRQAAQNLSNLTAVRRHETGNQQESA